MTSVGCENLSPAQDSFLKPQIPNPREASERGNHRNFVSLLALHRTLKSPRRHFTNPDKSILYERELFALVAKDSPLANQGLFADRNLNKLTAVELFLCNPW